MTMTAKRFREVTLSVGCPPDFELFVDLGGYIWEDTLISRMNEFRSRHKQVTSRNRA